MKNGSPAAPAPDAPEFVKQFEEAIASYARAVEAGHTEQAEAAALHAMTLAAGEAERNPTPSLQLKREAAECENRRDWVGAEAAYRKVLPLEEATGNFGLLAKPQMDLAGLLRCLGRVDEAWDFALAATDSARRCDLFPVLVMALECQASCALAKNDPATALAAASEAVQLIEPGKLYDHMRARVLVRRARCLLAVADLPAAETDLAASWKLLHDSKAPGSFPGPKFTLSLWWEVKSRVLEKQGNLQDACEAIRHCAELRRQLQSPNVTFALVETLERLARLSSSSGATAEAESAQAEAEALRAYLRLPAVGSG